MMFWQVRTRVRGAFVAVSLLTACDDGSPPPVPTDGGVADVQEVDARVAAGTCDDPIVLVGVEDQGVAVSFDTTEGESAGLTLPSYCGSQDLPVDVPIKVVAYQVPGEGPHWVAIDTAQGTTDPLFGTLFEVRTVCEEAPALTFTFTCFEGVREPRAAGVVRANGGDTLYIAITGSRAPPDDQTNKGPVTVGIVAGVDPQPELTGATVDVVGNTVTIVATGTDESANVSGVLAHFLDGSGNVVDFAVFDRGLSVWDGFMVEFTDSVAGQTSFSGSASRGGGYRLRSFGAVSAVVQIYDELQGTSDSQTVLITYSGGFGEACGAGSTCGPELVCEGASCVPMAENAADCAAAVSVPLVADGATRLHAVVSGEISTGSGHFITSCSFRLGAADGDEALFTVDVPAGGFNLIVARTDLDDVTQDTDTMIYVRKECGDPGSTPYPGCNDNVDFSTTDLRSQLEVYHLEAGPYTIFVEFVGGVESATRSFELDISVEVAP